VTASNSLLFRRSRLRGHLSRAVADERGISLILALLTLVVLGTLGTSVAVYATGHLHSTYGDQSAMNSYQLAEAGLNDAMSVLSQASQDAPTTFKNFVLPTTTVQYKQFGGSATFSGTSSTVNNTIVWALKSTGVAGNAGQVHSRTLTQSVTVRGVNEGADGSSWSRFYQDALSPCLTINNEVFVTNVATKGNLCILNSGGITGANTVVDVGGTVTITGPATSSGVHVPSAGAGWTSPGNVYANDSVYATNSVTAGTTGTSQDTTGFNFNIAPGAKILGITVSLERMASVCCNVNAVQTITETGSPTAGTFTITGTPPGGSSKTSASIARNATAATVTTTLAATTMYGAGNVNCTGSALPAAVVCTFQGAYASMPVSAMTFTKSGFSPSGATPVITNTTNGVSAALQDGTVQLLKAGSPVGNNKASATAWTTSPVAVNYGSSADLWGTTWTAADLNAGNFGLRFAAKNVGAGTATASLDYVTITVNYDDDTNGIGASGSPVAQANIGGTCTYNLGSAHTPCSSADHVWAGNITGTSADGVLQMPQVDYSYWWANAMPGPKHFCTNANPGMLTNFFDNDGPLTGTAPNQYTTGNTTAPNRSITINGEMAPNNADYTCQVWSIPPTGGQLLGELSWNHTTHILKIKGTVFVDGNFRFDEDGEVVNYVGRGTLMSSRDDEIDALVCAGWTGMETGATAPTTWAGSCLTHMATWNSTSNMMVLMSEMPNEYDQGSSTCSGNTPPTCYNGHLPAGFQGVMYSTSDCQIHQNFQDSGPVICNTITLNNESGINPTFYTFPSTGNLTDGQKYSDTATATHFELDPGPQTG
jgi:Tfp pilus assembly protein PilX